MADDAQKKQNKSFSWRTAACVCVMLAAIIAGALYAQHETRANGGYDSGLPVEKLTVHMKDGKSHTFDVEIAVRPIDLQVGLMYRKSMAPDHGMLFEMGKPQVTQFWMENTYIPLDMLFIDKTGTIVSLHANAEPLSTNTISSGKPVTAVLEINGGRAKVLGIAVGDRVEHKYFQ